MDTTGETTLDFPINDKLLEEAIQSREEWRVVRDRLTKADQSKGQVSSVVYERVRRDYEAKLREVTSELLRKKETVDREVATLAETRKKISTQLDNHRHKLEEIKFRNTLGEYTEEEYQSSARTEQDKIAKFETVLNAVETNIRRYESIFSEDKDILSAVGKGVAEMGDISAFTPVDHEAPPITDAKGFIIEEPEGGDYFAPTATDAYQSEESATAKDITGTIMPRVPKPKKRIPRVVIIGGEGAGNFHPIKGTITFGRAESNTVVLRNAKVSRQHAEIQEQGGGYVIIDLNSSNGTFVNGQRIDEHVLSNGDEIQIGDFTLQFQL